MFFIFCHAGIKLLFRNIHIIYLDVKILPGRQRITFPFNFIVAYSNREILYGFFILNVLTIKSMSSFSNLRFLFSLPYIPLLTCLHQSIWLFRQKQLCQRTRRKHSYLYLQHIAWHGDTAIYPAVINNFVKTFLSTPLFAVMNPVGITIAPLPVVFSELIRCCIKHR